MDTNNDGVISEEEFLEGCEKVRKLKDKFNYLQSMEAEHTVVWITLVNASDGSQTNGLKGKIVFFSISVHEGASLSFTDCTVLMLLYIYRCYEKE